jgi:Zn-dependent M16 (insulinase) family peptidase
MLSEGYLWDEIRGRRGAYGAGSNLGGAAVTFYSYRDPSPAESLEIFKEAILNGINLIDLSPGAIEDSIIASVKGMDPAVRPSMANGLAVLRLLREISIDTVTKHKTHLLSVNKNSIMEFAELLKSSYPSLNTCVAGNENTVESIKPNIRIEL